MHGALPPTAAVSLLLPIIHGMCAVHGAGIVHRDLKSNNSVVTHTGMQVRPTLLDFGIAKLRDEFSRKLTIEGLGLSPGVLYFFAPNLAVGLSLDLSYADRELETTPFTELDFGPSVGFGFHTPFSASLGFFPRVWLGAGYMRREYALFDLPQTFNDPTFQVESTPVTQGSYVSVQLLLPMSLQLAHATFISIGPSARLQWALKEGSRTFDFGVSAGIGRYF